MSYMYNKQLMCTFCECNQKPSPYMHHDEVKVISSIVARSKGGSIKEEVRGALSCHTIAHLKFQTLLNLL